MVRFIYRYNIVTNQNYEPNSCKEPPPETTTTTTTTTITTTTPTPWLV